VPRTTTGELIAGAQRVGHGVGAFNVVTIEHAEGIVAGAERAEAPVILQLSENSIAFHGRLAPIGLACLELARSAAVEVAVHLDHATSAELCREAGELGLSSVMFDAAALDYADNVAATVEVVAWASERGIWVEAELGEVGGKDGVHAPGARTDPDEAVRFVAATGVNALAVAVGSSHAMLRPEARLDLELVARLRDALPVPLVLHGSSGVPDDELGRAVGAGMVKINVGTQLNQAFTRACHEALATPDYRVDPRAFLRPARDAIAATVARLLHAVGASTAS
jgi:fructose-bisphosphate aldolase class II